MKLGDFFVELGIKTDGKGTKEIEKTISKLEELEKQVDKEIKREQELNKAENQEQKAKIKKKHAIQDEIKHNKKLLSTQKENVAGFKGMIKGVLGVATAIAVTVTAIDRMVTSLANANQKIINFQRTSGISLRTLNKYAQANVMANPLATIEGTAGSLSNIASNLWDIQLGRGDVSAYQELSYFSGKSVEPYGRSVTEVIEQVREALKSIPNDVQATNIITRMGFNPDDLMMLRMTNDEMERANKLFLSPEQREEMGNYNKELKMLHLQFALLKDELLLSVMPVLLKLEKLALPFVGIIKNCTQGVVQLVNYLTEIPHLMDMIGIAIVLLTVKLHPLLALVSALMILFEDVAGYFSGKKSAIGMLLYAIDEFKNSPKKSERNNWVTGSGMAMGFGLASKFIRPNQNSTDNRVSNVTINTNTPAVAESALNIAQNMLINQTGY